mmetsp:Transcript_46252/g.41371  ORF Transcript_46252/g.41371 Transcript_46252/m.41371 type:complete len:209 (-) Transcript_46252:739-1365(-)
MVNPASPLSIDAKVGDTVRVKSLFVVVVPVLLFGNVVGYPSPSLRTSSSIPELNCPNSNALRACSFLLFCFDFRHIQQISKHIKHTNTAMMTINAITYGLFINVSLAVAAPDCVCCVTSLVDVVDFVVDVGESVISFSLAVGATVGAFTFKTNVGAGVVGLFVGDKDGDSDGLNVGSVVGSLVGSDVGSNVGSTVGSVVGSVVGLFVG